MLFQEQILRLAVHYTGMDWEEADQFRKTVSVIEEQGELEALRPWFLAGASRTCQAAAHEALEVFRWCAAFRGYGFAESHAWTFAQYSYARAYLRHHFPALNLAAFLTEAPACGRPTPWLWPMRPAPRG